MKKLFLSVTILGSLLYADIFDKGRSNVSGSVGLGSSMGNTYSIVGVNADYMLFDNISAGASYRGWFGADPMQNEISGRVNYYLPLNKKIYPYAGVFIKDTFVSGYRDFVSYGTRGGISMITRKNMFASVGYVYEVYDTCVYKDECSTSYPEFIFGLSF
jgi:hypothetical protein